MLDDLEKKLYSQERGENSRKIEKNFDKNADADNKILSSYQSIGWNEKIETDFGKSFEKSLSKINRISKWFFWIVAPLMFLAIAGTGFYLYKYFSVDREISFLVTAPENAVVGVPFDLKVAFNNDSTDTLTGSSFSLFLPEGVLVLGEKGDKRIFKKEIGSLEPGGSFQDQIKLVIFGEVSEIKNLKATINYLSSLRTPLEKIENFEISAKESGIKLDLTAPEKVLNNEEFEITINYSNVSNFDFSGARLKLDFPSKFSLKESNQILSGNYLEIGNLTKGDEKKILIKGKIIGSEQAFFDIKAGLEADYGGEKYLISGKTASLYIAPSPLSLKIVLNESDNYIILPGDTLKYKIIYRNNTDVGLSDAVIIVQLAGEMFDFASVKTNGGFNSKNNTLNWNAANVSELKQLAAGAIGSVEFTIGAKQNYPIKKLSDKNFVLKILAEISSPTVPYYVAADKTIGISSLENKVAGYTIIEPQVYFNDLSLGAPNKGFLPPKVNQATNFTVHWVVRNYSNNIKDINIKAFLAPGVRFTGLAKSNVSSTPVYNDRTQEVSWAIDRIAATKGIIGKPVEAIFQIEAMPNITQINHEMPLMGNTTLKAVDEFTNLQLNYTTGPMTTRDLKDSGLDPQKTLVSP